MQRRSVICGFAEHRLIGRGDLKQFAKDLNEFHIRTDDPVATAGSVVMAPVVALTKLGNAVAGEFSDRMAQPLGEGAFKYTARDIKSLVGNTASAVKNLLTLHPLRAAGNVIKGAFDGLDLTLDPFLDVGSGIAGHTRRQAAATLSSAA
ncbi:MAG: hypothetical protein PHS73_02420 [Candidatus Peribacteraceae bacterium]|nr:hypothetical protein [Candidatus Peribacteraceae bacterium]